MISLNDLSKKGMLIILNIKSLPKMAFKSKNFIIYFNERFVQKIYVNSRDSVNEMSIYLSISLVNTVQIVQIHLSI